MNKTRPNSMLVFIIMAIVLFGIVAVYMPSLEVSMNYSNSGEPCIRPFKYEEIRSFFGGMYVACLTLIVMLISYCFKRTRVVSIIAIVFLVLSLALVALSYGLNYTNLVHGLDFLLCLGASCLGIICAIIAAIMGIVKEPNRNKDRIEQLEAEIEQLKRNAEKRH